MKINLPLRYSLDRMINIKAEKKQFGFCSLVVDDILYYLIYKKKLSPKQFNQEKFELQCSLSIADINHTGVAGQYFLIVGKTKFFILKTFYQGIYEVIYNPFYFEEKKAYVKSKREQKELLKMKQYLQFEYVYQERVKLSYIFLQKQKISLFNPIQISSISEFDTTMLPPDIAHYFEKIKKIYQNFLSFSQIKLNELNHYLDIIFNFIDVQYPQHKKIKKI